MTRRSDEDAAKLERALAEAYRSRREPALGVDWVRHVMRDIRREEERAAMPFAGVAGAVWRGAAVAAVLALIFTASMLVYTGGDAGELTALLVDELDTGSPPIE